MCQSLTAGFQASLSFIFYKMGDGYSTYQRVKLMVPSGCEGKLGVALESLQGLRDLT